MPPLRAISFERWSIAHAAGLLVALGIALSTRQLPVLLVGAVSIAALLPTAPARPLFGFGAANALTTTRVALVSVGLVAAPRSLVIFGAIALVAFALDGVDGWLARRLGEASVFGARLDVEADAYAMLVTCAAVVLHGGGPWWVLAAGSVRYAYVLSSAAVAPAGVSGTTMTPPRRSRVGRLVFFVTMSSLIAACFPLPDRPKSVILALGVAAVLASFVVDFRLLGRAQWRLRAVLGLGVLLDLALFSPAIVFAGAPSAPEAIAPVVDTGAATDVLHVSAEWVALCTLVALAARTRLAPAVRWLGASSYVALLVFLFYHKGYLFFFRRPPAIVSDVRLLVHLFHFVKGELVWAILAVAAIGALVLSWMLVAELFRQLEAHARAVRWSRLVAGSLGALGVVSGSLAWSGIERAPPVVQLLSKHVVANARFSRVRRERERALAEAPPDRRNDCFVRPVLVRKPNVHLLMVESYGAILATSEMHDAFREAVEDLESRLVPRGYTCASGYSASPVWGGGSWFGISTVQTGVPIDNQETYEVLEAASAQLPSLTSFFRAQGYTTIAIMAGNNIRAGLKRYDLFGRDIVFDGPSLEYEGARFGWFIAPDQWALGFYRERVLRRQPGPTPRFVYFMSVSTHWPWTQTPPYVEDWRTLDKPNPPAIVMPPRRGAERIQLDVHRRYFGTVDYDLAVLRDYILAEDDDSALYVIIGDHQPALEAATGKETPVHVISRDAALVDRFRAHGFSRRLFAEPEGGAHIDHAGVFSLIASVLAEHAGDGTKLPYYPGGLPTAALKR